jgi:hypothetical protein
MNALSHEFAPADAALAPATLGNELSSSLCLAELEANWAALHDAANAIAQLAQLAAEETSADIAALPQRTQRITGGARQAIENGVDDLAIVMATGLTALLSATSKGKDASAAALTLWLEFHAGRRAILAFAEPMAGTLDA